jgi:hypothetical protein
MNGSTAYRKDPMSFRRTKCTEAYIGRLSDNHWGIIARKHGMPVETTAQHVTDYPRRQRKTTMTFLALLQELQQICNSINWGTR